jgi:hypothetical protein
MRRGVIGGVVLRPRDAEGIAWSWEGKLFGPTISGTRARTERDLNLGKKNRDC